MELLIFVGPVTILVLIIRQLVRVVRVKQSTEESAESVGKKRFFLLMSMLQNLLCLIAVIFFGWVVFECEICSRG